MTAKVGKEELETLRQSYAKQAPPDSSSRRAAEALTSAAQCWSSASRTRRTTSFRNIQIRRFPYLRHTRLSRRRIGKNAAKHGRLGRFENHAECVHPHAGRRLGKFPQAADPSLTVCGTACDSAKPPKTQSIQGLNGCYFIEDVTKKVPKSQNFGTLTWIKAGWARLHLRHSPQSIKVSHTRAILCNKKKSSQAINLTGFSGSGNVIRTHDTSGMKNQNWN